MEHFEKEHSRNPKLPDLMLIIAVGFGARKLREQQAAREMEKRYTKEQILEAYINLIEFGHGWNGVEMAARHYFGKGAAEYDFTGDPTTPPEVVRSKQHYYNTRMADAHGIAAWVNLMLNTERATRGSDRSASRAAMGAATILAITTP